MNPLLDSAKKTFRRAVSKIGLRPTVTTLPVHIDAHATNLDYCPLDIQQKLSAVQSLKQVPKFDLNGQLLWVRLVKIYDGDSPCVMFLFKDQIYRTATRLSGLDTPEIRAKDSKEKTLAIRARNRVAAWALPGVLSVDGNYTDKQIKEALWQHPVMLFMKCEHDDKFARVLCTLYRAGEPESINSILLREGFADPYDGGRKQRTWA